MLVLTHSNKYTDEFGLSQEELSSVHDMAITITSINWKRNPYFPEKRYCPMGKHSLSILVVRTPTSRVVLILSDSQYYFVLGNHGTIFISGFLSHNLLIVLKTLLFWEPRNACTNSYVELLCSVFMLHCYEGVLRCEPPHLSHTSPPATTDLSAVMRGRMSGAAGLHSTRQRVSTTARILT